MEAVSAMATFFKLHSTYNIVTLFPGILGANYNGVKITNIMDFNEAISNNEDVQTRHRQLLSSSASVSMPIDPRDLTYIKFIDSFGKSQVFATAWIDLNTTVEIHSQTLEIRISGVDSHDINEITQMLKRYKIASIKIL